MKKRTTLLILLTLALASVICRAGVYKSGGDYEVLQDTFNARGGESTGGGYTALSSTGQRFSNGSADTNSYTLVSGVMGAIDTTPPVVAFTSPLPAQAASGTVTAIGTAFDGNDIQWTLYVGGGSSPDTWKELSSGTGNQALDYAFGQWDSSHYSGDYTYKIVAVDTHGNTAEGTVTFDVDYTYTITGTLPAFEWVFLGVPVDVESTDPVSIFGASAEYKVYKWDPTAETDQYLDKYKYPEYLNPGDGFWIRAYYDDLSYTYSGSPVVTNADHRIQLSKGWNMISSPYSEKYLWGATRVEYQGESYDLTAAATAGLLDPILYTYDITGKSWIQNSLDSKMQPQVGAYINALESLTLVFDPENRTLARPVRQVVDYRINVSARGDESADVQNYFGAVSLAKGEYDAFDSKEPPRSMAAIEGKYTTLYFPREDWKVNAGRYTNDMRPRSGVGDTESWSFNVDTNEIGKTIELKWDGDALPADRFSFTLVNLDNGETIDMTATGVYSYLAEGDEETSTRFMLDVTRIEVETSTVSHVMQPGWNLMSIPLDTLDTDAVSQLGNALSDLSVVQFYDKKYYRTQSDEGVDFQAGIAYWIHSKQVKKIEFSGLFVDEGSIIEVPLKKGFNLIGSPFQTDLTFGDNLSVVVDNGEISLSEAIATEALEGALYRYDTLTGAYVKTEFEGIMTPWEGYFIKALTDCVVKLKK